MADIMHLLTVRAAPERVYTAVATPEGVRSWWTPDADLDLHVGGVGEFRFHGGGKITRVRIEALEPPSRIVWRTIGSFRPEWADTVITFRIRPSPREPCSCFPMKASLMPTKITRSARPAGRST